MKENNFKPSPLGPIPHDWEVTPLGSLGEVQMCKRIFSHQTTEIGEIPFFKIGTLGKEPDAFISRTLFEEYRSKYNFPIKGEMLISAAGTIGRTVEYDGRECYFQDSNIIWLRNDETSVSNDFLAKAFKVIKWQSQDGGTISRLYNSNFRATSLCHPNSHAEQERIAGVLSDVDELIATTEALLQKKRDIKQGTMQQLLSGKLRLPGFSDPWVEISMLSIFQFIRGKGLSKSSISTSGLFPCILYGQLFTSYKEVISEVISYTDIDDGTPSKCGDLLMPCSTTTRGEDLAICSTVLDDDIRIGGDTLILRPNQDFKINNIYFSYTVPSYKADIVKCTHGVTIVHLQTSKLKEIIVKLPSLTEQDAIAKVLSDMDAEIEALEGNLNKYKAIREAMMQQLLTGKIRLI